MPGVQGAGSNTSPEVPPQPPTMTTECRPSGHTEGSEAATPGPLATWPARAYAALVDIAIWSGLLNGAYMLVTMIDPVYTVLAWTLGFFDISLVRSMTWTLTLGWWGWQWIQRGRTGQTLGQHLIGVRVVDQATGEPIGPARSVVRSLTHVADIAPLCWGLIRPGWSRDRQTWADRIHRTVVVTAPAPRLAT